MLHAEKVGLKVKNIKMKIEKKTIVLQKLENKHARERLREMSE
jgi:hypothetical protein